MNSILKAGLALLIGAFSICTAAQEPGPEHYAREVDMRLDVPPDEQADYANKLAAALANAGIADSQPQYFILVDRSPMIQAVFVYWGSSDVAWHLIGASPVSTGRPGAYDHFLTPLGVFEHSLANLDFRAEGTRNSNGIRGYGSKGMRIYDFGWAKDMRTWGAPGLSQMRLQMHATDPDILEPLLGGWHSKGCIRIPTSLNIFIDRHGLLDSDYDAAARAGRHFWVLHPDRAPTPWPGRWLVVIDSERRERPAWSPPPPQVRRK